MKLHCLIMSIMLLISANCYSVEPTVVQNPVDYFINRYPVDSIDDIYQFEFDINEDGLLDVFISSNNKNMRSGGGKKGYHAFIATVDGYITSDNAGFDIDGKPIIKRIKELGNKLAFMWYDKTGGKTTIAAFYCDESSKDLIKEEVLARLDYHSVENDPNETKKLKEQEDKYIRVGLEKTNVTIKRITVVDVVSESRLAEMKTRESNKQPLLSDIYDYGPIIVDEDGVHSKVALFEKGTRNIAGWMDDVGKFIPKKPGEVLPILPKLSGGSSEGKQLNTDDMTGTGNHGVQFSNKSQPTDETNSINKWIVIIVIVLLVLAGLGMIILRKSKK